MQVRKVRPNDHEGWNPLWQGYQKYYQVDLSETTENTWQRLMTPEADGPFCMECEEEAGE